MNAWLHRVADMDRSALLSINGAHSPVADTLMWYVSDGRVWIPLYILFLVMIQRRWDWRGLLCSLPVIAVMILLSDTGSVLLFKNTVQRLRPSHAPELAGMVHLVNGYVGGQFGFVSSHAANHAAIAAFMIGVLQHRPRWSTLFLAFWVILVCYSRVYLGVHYPLDVIVGAAYGAVIGGAMSMLFRRIKDRRWSARPVTRQLPE